MATNSKEGMPEGTKYKVNLEKAGKTNFMMVYALDKDEAIASVQESWIGTGWKVTGVEEAK